MSKGMSRWTLLELKDKLCPASQIKARGRQFFEKLATFRRERRMQRRIRESTDGLV